MNITREKGTCSKVSMFMCQMSIFISTWWIWCINFCALMFCFAAWGILHTWVHFFVFWGTTISQHLPNISCISQQLAESLAPRSISQHLAELLAPHSISQHLTASQNRWHLAASHSTSSNHWHLTASRSISQNRPRKLRQAGDCILEFLLVILRTFAIVLALPISLQCAWSPGS